MQTAERPRLTESVKLPGGQDRLRLATLYVSMRFATAARFGLVKLNKTLWKADFESYAARKVPVTGRPYQRLPQGPVPREMPHVLADLLRDDMIKLEETNFGDGIVEKRPVAYGHPNMTNFSKEDIFFLDMAVDYYWSLTGGESSDDSHGIAWKSRANSEPMYYELSYLSDEQVGPIQAQKMLERAKTRGWHSQ